MVFFKSVDVPTVLHCGTAQMLQKELIRLRNLKLPALRCVDVIVRYRIDGILHDAMTLPKPLATGIVARIKVLSNLKLDEHRLPQDGRFKI
jgi:hypothetical protein